MAAIKLDRIGQITNNLITYCENTDAISPEKAAELKEEMFLIMTDRLGATFDAIRKTVNGNITAEDYYAVLEQEVGITAEEIEYLKDNKIIREPEFIEEVER